MHLALSKENNHFDVIVIGGGASGMMAACVASGCGKRVLVLEKNTVLGKKLRISGGGRCNVTNNKTDVRDMVAMYKDASQFLMSSFTSFGVRETKELFSSWGLSFVEENDGRLFPSTHDANTVADMLVKQMQHNGVSVILGSEVKSIQNAVGGFTVSTKTDVFTSLSLVVATGGLSHKETGSTGDGYTFLKSLGHTVLPTNVSLVPLRTKDVWSHALSGVSLTDVKISVIQFCKRVYSKVGKVLFTHVGVSGPAILQMSRGIGEILPEGEVTLSFDLYPTLDIPDVKKLVHDALTKESNKKIKNVLGVIVPQALVPQILFSCSVDGDTPCHSVSTEERKRIVAYVKNITITVGGLLGTDKAIVSSGGVPCKDVDGRTFESKICKNLYITGDLLDIDRPSGGYSLQLCWTTGYCAGLAVQ
jgi:predicted Rossmann fold flavoprotein